MWNNLDVLTKILPMDYRSGIHGCSQWDLTVSPDFGLFVNRSYLLTSHRISIQLSCSSHMNCPIKRFLNNKKLNELGFLKYCMQSWLKLYLDKLRNNGPVTTPFSDSLNQPSGSWDPTLHHTWQRQQSSCSYCMNLLARSFLQPPHSHCPVCSHAPSVLSLQRNKGIASWPTVVILIVHAKGWAHNKHAHILFSGAFSAFLADKNQSVKVCRINRKVHCDGATL